MRRELKKRNIKKLKVVYSDEKPVQPVEDMSAGEEQTLHSKRRSTPGSTAYVPAVAGLLIAGEIVKDLCRR